MSMSDPISDMLTRIRNAQMVGKKDVAVPLSKNKVSIVKVLEKEGYIQSFHIENEDVVQKSQIIIRLKYYLEKPVIESIKRVSKPGLRVYCSAKNIPLVLEGLGVAILSTSVGVIVDREARMKKVGGEVLCTVV